MAAGAYTEGMSPRPFARVDPSRPRLCVGLISGTSVDGVEAVVCRVEGTGESVQLKLMSHVSFPFPPEFIQRVLGPQDARSLCELNFELGERFAEAAQTVISRAGLRPGDVDVIGSHGQTMAHLPSSLSTTPSTLQLGEACVIAERTGLPVVSDFRTRDMAAGGQGAPLVPYFDWAAFRKPGVVRAFQNIGGIANVSVVGERLDDVLAFDTGPGNMVLDGLARRVTGGRLQCDLDGQLSGKGTVIAPLLAELLTHPFFTLPPPRSAGREGFGETLVSFLWEHYPDRGEDLLATALEFTVEATARAYEAYVLPRFKALEAVYVSGGGSRNPALMERFRARLSPLPVRSLDTLGFPEGAKEAACFALLAAEHMVGTPANVPSATGARRRVVLGKLTP
jgi:anhydro-N-acetylmuramic acid kinase